MEIETWHCSYGPILAGCSRLAQPLGRPGLGWQATWESRGGLPPWRWRRRPEDEPVARAVGERVEEDNSKGGVDFGAWRRGCAHRRWLLHVSATRHWGNEGSGRRVALGRCSSTSRQGGSMVGGGRPRQGARGGGRSPTLDAAAGFTNERRRRTCTRRQLTRHLTLWLTGGSWRGAAASGK
jgi:hypothetical protein